MKPFQLAVWALFISVAALAAAAIAVLVHWSDAALGGGGDVPHPSRGPEAGFAASPIRFQDASAAAGVRFVHRSRSTRPYMPDIMGSGLAWGDYDVDGWPDLFLVNGALRADTGTPLFPPSRLYHNDGNGRFTDVTVQAGAASRGLGMGAVWADYDNDGWPDLYVTDYVGANHLYHNNGDGTLTDVTRRAGVAGHGAGMGAAWGDVDRDGFVDLYVPSHTEFSFSMKRPSSATGFRGDYSDPGWYHPKRGILYHNNGDGTFTDATDYAGAFDIGGRGLQAVFADLDNDGWPDLFIGNDVSLNVLYRNRGDGRFDDISVQAYMADKRNSMGIALGDDAGAGVLDIYCSHWKNEGNALFRNTTADGPLGRQALSFSDVNAAAALREPSMPVVGWGDAFLDADNDGRLDIVVVNGETNLFARPVPLEPPHLFWNRGDGTYVESGASAGPFFRRGYVARGLAVADYDRDGRPDAAVTTNNGAGYLIRNVTPRKNHWLRLTLRGASSNRDAVGARVLVTAGGRTQIRELIAGESYLSCHELTQIIGVGGASAADAIVVRWPSGSASVVGPVPAGTSVVLAEQWRR